MGDAENFQPSKTRVAGVQLSRDNPGLDDEEETPEGTFKKASEEVLATRRIVKVRRQQPTTPAASTPFAAIRLVNPSSTPSVVEAPIDQSKEAKADKSISENIDEPSIDVSNTEEKTAENKVDDSKTQPKDENDTVVNEDKEKSLETEVAESGNSGDGATKSPEADTVETQTGKGVKDDGDEKDKENEETAEKNDEKDQENEETAEKKDKTVPFGSFQILSSSQNAFSGLAGTGFSSTSFSFGSLTKYGTGLNCAGSNNGNSSIFGSVMPVSSIGKIESRKFPPMQDVPLETGEENESAVFTADSVLFEYIDGAWKERGKGELKVNVSTTGTGKARLVMRARGNYRLILNASLFPDMKLTEMDHKKGITFACVNSCGEGKDGLSTFALKFKDPSMVEYFQTVVTNHKSPAALKTPEISPKADE